VEDPLLHSVFIKEKVLFSEPSDDLSRSLIEHGHIEHDQLRA